MHCALRVGTVFLAMGVIAPATALCQAGSTPDSSIHENLVQPGATSFDAPTGKTAPASGALEPASANSAPGAGPVTPVHEMHAGPAPAPITSSPDGASLPASPNIVTTPPTTYGTRRKLALEAAPMVEDPKAFTLSITAGTGWLTYPIVPPSQPSLTVDYAAHGPSFRLQAGRQIHDQFQFQFDLSLQNFIATVPGTDGSTSGDQTTLRLYTGTLGMSYRFDYFYEQPVVPYLSAGLAATAAVVKDVVTTSADSIPSGHRLGGYVGGGLEFLLDVFEPTRAADLELSSGINDTYLVLDLRYNWLQHYVGEDASGNTGLQNDTQYHRYSGFQFTAGLKFDF